MLFRRRSGGRLPAVPRFWLPRCSDNRLFRWFLDPSLARPPTEFAEKVAVAFLLFPLAATVVSCSAAQNLLPCRSRFRGWPLSRSVLIGGAGGRRQGLISFLFAGGERHLLLSRSIPTCSSPLPCLPRDHHAFRPKGSVGFLLILPVPLYPSNAAVRSLRAEGGKSAPT